MSASTRTDSTTSSSVRAESHEGPITLGGHSSGGGLAIRFAGGPYAREVSSYLIMTPIIPQSRVVRDGTAGGWVNLNLKRLFGLLVLNAIGIHGFNGLPIIDFNKPAKFWDGTETLSYSYRLNVSYHPRYRYENDIRALPEQTLVMIGGKDEANDPEALRTLIAADAPRARLNIVPDLSHFGIFTDPAALELAAAWLRGLPGGTGH